MSRNFLIHAGHGLTERNIVPLIRNGLFREYNIGHWVVCQAVFDGLLNVVGALKKLLASEVIHEGG